VIATIVLAFILFPLELLLSLVGGNEVGVTSAAIRALWRDRSGEPHEPRRSAS
jgi:hypothetical protein